MKKLIDYVLIALAVINIVLASVTAIDVKLEAVNKPLSIVLVFLYVIIATLVMAYLYAKKK